MAQGNPNLSLNQQGREVALLQSRLITLGYTIATPEILNEFFGQSTYQAVLHFQQREGLHPTGMVDAATAQAIVHKYESDRTVIWSAPPSPPASQVPPASHYGTASMPPHTKSQAMPPAAQPGVRAQPPVEVVRASTPPVSSLPVTPQPQPIQAQPGIPVVPPGGVVVPPPPGGVIVPPPPGGTIPPVQSGSGNTLQGKIYLEHGLPANGLAVRLYNRGFGGADTLIGNTKTDAQGAYTFTYSPANNAFLNLDVRIVGADGKEISLSAPQYNPAAQKTLNLIAPASVQPLAPEYQRLSSDLQAHLGTAVANLGNAQEDTSRQDLTFLAQTTGWDPRLLSLAATANKLSVTTQLGQDTLYALFRAGLPTDPQQLAWVDSTAVQKALNATNQAGISNFSDQQITAATSAFTNFARQARLATQVPGTTSSFGDLLGKIDLATEQKTAFADLYFSHPASSTDFWQQVQKKGLPPAALESLRLQGKLAYLTLNNAQLASAIQQEIGSDPAELVNKDLYKPDGWKTRLQNLAGSDPQALQKLIPSTYIVKDANVANGLDVYANDLARKVRMSYPTQVIGRMLANNELRLNQGKDNQGVQTFLQHATSLGFVLGRTPIDNFISANHEKVFPNETPDQVATTTQGVKMLHRLYQITPTNEALKVMLDQGFTSAHDVVTYTPDHFIKYYGGLFPSQDEAWLVYRKSQQVTVVTQSFFSSAQQIISIPPVFTVAAPLEDRQLARDNLIKQYPSLSTLFGSLDFCECEHCNSVLSPAAYFVDLLQFLEHGQNDPHSTLWPTFLSDWKANHGNAPYPFLNQTAWTTYLNDWHAAHPGSPDPDPEKTPYTVLTERRPDLPYLPLTCENTNTVMPYIDIVNEILEYFIAHGSLDQNAVHDTGSSTTADLLAEPQNILPAAYDTLKKALYPLNLPFDLWFATVRAFFDYYQMPFWQVLDVFRPSEELFAPLVIPHKYYRSFIFAEYLGITPSEYALYTSATPLTNWFALYGYQNEAGALSALPSAKTLAERLGVSYKELIALVETGFVNPQLQTLGILYKLEITVEDVLRYKGQSGYPAFSGVEKSAFEQKLTNLSATFSSSGFDAKAWLDAAWLHGDFNTILVLYDTNPAGNFDQTTLRYANGTAADALVFLKLNLFVRLWKRLAWSMEEVDRALQVFLPQHSLPLTGANIGAAFTTVLLSLAHITQLLGKCQVGPHGRLQLLTLWSNLATAGATPLYAQLFLTKSILQNDLVFDHPLGLYLTYFNTTSQQYLPFHWDSSQAEDPKTGNVSLKTHLNAVQGALGLSADEPGQILADAGKTLDNEPLTLENLSLLYRYSLLARGLGLAVKDMITLKNLSGLDPFKALSPDPITQLADDYPLTQTLGFVDIVKAVKGSGFTVEDLNYLLRQRIDPVGKYRSDPNAVLTLLRTLASGIRGIQNDTTVPTTASRLTDDFLRQKLALALPSDAVDTFFAMWTGTITCTVVQNNVVPADQLHPSDYTGEPEIQVSYDAVRQAQQLTFRGVLFDTQRAQIELTHASPVLAGLLNQVEALAQTYFVSYLQPFLNASDFTTLFTPLDSSLSDADRQAQMQTRRHQFAQAFFPYLQQKLIRQFVVSTVATTLAADPALVEDLLTDTSLLNDPTNRPAPGQPLNALLGAFTASADQGVTVAYYASQDESGLPLSSAALAADVATTGKPGGTNSAHFEGYLEVPANGPYRFFVELGKSNAHGVFHLTNWPDPLLDVTASADNSENSQFIDLKAGIPYHFTFDITVLGGGDASLFVQGENLPKGELSRLTLYTQQANERITRVQTLLAKTLQLMQTFSFSAVEMRYFLTHPDDFAHLNLSALPTQPADDTPAGASALFAQFLRLAQYTSLKGALALTSDDLVDLFAHARLIYPVTVDPAQVQSELFTDLCQRVANLTRRDVATVQAVAKALNFSSSVTPQGSDQVLVAAPAFAQDQGVQRLWNALQTISALGVSMDELTRWLTPELDFTVARDLRNTLKSHYGSDDWQRIAQPIFDKLRQLQRDALVAYIMYQQGFTLPEQLFEYFLIDPGMEPVVQTSRLVLAISSVQTFIQRCLLNLELEVNPLAINADQWQWMKRYRVWEANRKIFLFPENWLEPEFRDDKTNLFLDLESKLLQSDISNDLAEDAFFNYLKGLDELARLEIVSLYCEEHPDPADNVLHVIGRTYNTPHKYFYRTCSNQMWTPWVPVTINVDGDHVALVVWKQRLHLFWATLTVKARQDASSGSSSSETYKQMGDDAVTSPPQQVDVQLNWSEYFQGKWVPPQTSGFGHVSDIGSGIFDPHSVFIYISKETHTDADGSVVDGAVDIHLTSPVNLIFRIINKNSTPQALNESSWLPYEPYSYSGMDATGYDASGELTVSYVQEADSDNNFSFTTKTILQQGGDYTLLFADNVPQVPFGDTNTNEGWALNWFDSPYLIDLLTRPFFYQDLENTFFVEPTMTEIKIDEWDWWVIPYPWPYQHLNNDHWWNNLKLQATVPVTFHLPSIAEIDQTSLYQLKPVQDWATRPATVLRYGGNFVGQTGGLITVPQPTRNGIVGGGIQFKPVAPGSALGSIATLVNGNGHVLNGGNIGGLLRGGGINLVNQGGLTRGVLQDLQLEQSTMHGNGAFAQKNGLE